MGAVSVPLRGTTATTVYLGASGVTWLDSVPVLLLVTLVVSADSVSLRVGLDSSDSLEARDPEFSLM